MTGFGSSFTVSYSLRTKIVTHIKFSGDYQGEFIFLFTQKSMGVIINHILLDSDEYKGEDYLDAMSEFVNSLTGKLKSNLRKDNKCIQFDLPISTVKLESTVPSNSQQKFIFTSFKCNKSEYHVALSSPIETEYDILEL